MNSIEAFVPPEVVKTFAAFLEFCYIAHRNIITNNSLKELKVVLDRFHVSRQVFLGTVWADGPLGFSLPRQHLMMHYYDHIKNFGSPNGLCSSITESKHIVAVKCPWRRSNKHAALPQMFKVNKRLDKLVAVQADFAARGMLVDSCLIQAIKDTFSGDSEDLMDEDMDSDESDDPTADEINALDHNRPLDNEDPLPLENREPYTPSVNNNRANRVDNNHANRVDNNHTNDDRVDNNHTNNDRTNINYSPSNQDPPTLPNDEDDEDCGPVESGPLMNEVRLACKKGRVLSP